MIKMQVIGNLGKDCVVNTVNGKNVINFTVAHSEKYKDSQGNNQEKTTWVDCAYWTDRTAISPYLTKGKQVFVEGTPEVVRDQGGRPGQVRADRLAVRTAGPAARGAHRLAAGRAACAGHGRFP